MLTAALWGLIQGLTEFLPISSSGHLILIPALLGVDGPDLATSLDLATLTATASFRGAVPHGRGIALCDDGAVPLVALGDAFPAVILDPFVGAVFDNLALGGEFIVTVGGDEDAARETVFSFEGRTEAPSGARRAAGTLRLLRATSPPAAGLGDDTLPWSASIR